MAIEIAVRISGNGGFNWKQAIFLQESDLDGTLGDITLKDIRTAIAKQGIEVPNEYRFLSVNENAIPLALEEVLPLREVGKAFGRWTKDAVKPDISEEEINANQIVKEKTESVPELWLTSLEENPACKVSDRNGESSAEQDTQVNQDKRDDAGNVHFCPWKGFVKFVHDGDNNPRNLFKFLFFLVVILFMMLVSLVLTTQVIFGTLSSLTASPGFNSILSNLKSDGSSAEELTNFRVKLSGLELSWQYKFDQLSNKMAELEDLYLNDLALHKRNMASLKNQQTDVSGDFASHKELEALAARLDQLVESARSSQLAEGGKIRHGKKGKRNKVNEGA